MELFTQAEQTQHKPLETNGKRCNSCKFIISKRYNNSSFFYCSKYKSKSTTNGYLKIKSSNKSCQLFEQEQEKHYKY